MRSLEEIVIDWMSRKGPPEWHGVATAWNWDQGEAPLLWILEQPTCDKATALRLFWDGECFPQLHPDNRGYAPGETTHTIAHLVATNWERYPTSRFKFELPYYVRHLQRPDWGMSPEGLKALRPLLVHIHGQERYPIYDQGVPSECWITFQEAHGGQVSDLRRQLLAEELAGKNLSATDAEIAERAQRELQESLADLDAMIAHVERIRREQS